MSLVKKLGIVPMALAAMYTFNTPVYAQDNENQPDDVWWTTEDMDRNEVGSSQPVGDEQTPTTQLDASTPDCNDSAWKKHFPKSWEQYCADASSRNTNHVQPAPQDNTPKYTAYDHCGDTPEFRAYLTKHGDTLNSFGASLTPSDWSCVEDSVIAAGNYNKISKQCKSKEHYAGYTCATEILIVNDDSDAVADTNNGSGNNDDSISINNNLGGNQDSGSDGTSDDTQVAHPNDGDTTADPKDDDSDAVVDNTSDDLTNQEDSALSNNTVFDYIGKPIEISLRGGLHRQTKDYTGLSPEGQSLNTLEAGLAYRFNNRFVLGGVIGYANGVGLLDSSQDVDSVQENTASGVGYFQFDDFQTYLEESSRHNFTFGPLVGYDVVGLPIAQGKSYFRLRPTVGLNLNLGSGYNSQDWTETKSFWANGEMIQEDSVDHDTLREDHSTAALVPNTGIHAMFDLGPNFAVSAGFDMGYQANLSQDRLNGSGFYVGGNLSLIGLLEKVPDSKTDNNQE